MKKMKKQQVMSDADKIIRALESEWKALAPDYPMPKEFWREKLLLLHPSVIRAKLKVVAEYKMAAAPHNYLKVTLEDKGVLQFQRFVGLKPLFTQADFAGSRRHEEAR
jgi:hypothetical protein